MKKLILLILTVLVLSGCEKEVCNGDGVEYGKSAPEYTLFYVESMPCVRMSSGGLSCDWSKYRLGQ